MKFNSLLKKAAIILGLSAVCSAGLFAQTENKNVDGKKGHRNFEKPGFEQIYSGKIVTTKVKGAEVVVLVSKNGTYVLTTMGPSAAAHKKNFANKIEKAESEASAEETVDPAEIEEKKERKPAFNPPKPVSMEELKKYNGFTNIKLVGFVNPESNVLFVRGLFNPAPTDAK